MASGEHPRRSGRMGKAPEDQDWLDTGSSGIWAATMGRDLLLRPFSSCCIQYGPYPIKRGGSVTTVEPKRYIGLANG